MENKNSEKAIEIIKEYRSKSNKDLIFALEFIKQDFEFSKNSLLKLTEHIDKLETTYNVLLKEYQNRTNVRKG